MVNAQLLQKLERYCAYQERSHKEAEQKAKSIGLSFLESQYALKHLIENNFLNEERFALLFVKSNVNQKKWGPIKIKNALFNKGISARLINYATASIETGVWNKNLEYLALKYLTLHKLDLENPLNRKKLTNYLLSKGYTLDNISEFKL